MTLRRELLGTLQPTLRDGLGLGLPWSPGAGGASVSAPTVSISGTRGVGLNLTATVTGVPTPTVQWQRANVLGGGGSPTWSDIGSATSTTYTQVAADVGFDIRCRASNAVQSNVASNTLSAQTPATIMSTAAKGIWDDRSATMTGATWTDQAAINNLTGAGGAQPGAGTAINGHATLSFDGVDDFMTGTGNIGTRMTNNAYGIWWVLRTGNAVVTESTPMTDRALVADSFQEFAIGVTTTPRHTVLDTTNKSTANGSTYANSTVYAGRAYHDGSNLHHKVTGTTDQTVAAGTIDAMTGVFRVGINSSGATFTKMDLAALYVMNATPSAQQILDMDGWEFCLAGVAP